MRELSRLQRNHLRTAALKSLFFLCRYVLGMKDLSPDIHGPYCKKLESPARYKQAWLPRGWYKTSVGAEGWPIWVTLPEHDPMATFGICSNVVENSEKMVGQIMWHYEQNELFQCLFPEVIPDFKRDWGKKAACIRRPRNIKEATFEAVGIGGTGTTRHFSHLVEDDLLYPKRDELTHDEIRPSQSNIETAVGFHRNSYNLWKDRKTGVKLVQGTRMSLYDLYHHIETKEPQYQECTYIRKMVENGQPAWPDRFGWPEIEQAKRDLGPYLFSTQMLMEAVAPEDMVFQEEWITGGPEGSRYWKTSSDILAKNPTVYVLVDPAIGEERRHDFTAILTVAVTQDDHRWVLTAKRGKWNPERLVSTAFDELAKWPKINAVGIEMVSGFGAFKYLFLREMVVRGVSYRIIDLKPDNRDKDSRIQAMQPLFSAGKVHLGMGMAELRDDLLSFPHTKHRDLLDALAYHVDVVRPPKIEVVIPKPHPNSYEAIEEQIEEQLRPKNRLFNVQDNFYGIPDGDEIEVDDYFAVAAMEREES